MIENNLYPEQERSEPIQKVSKAYFDMSTYTLHVCVFTERISWRKVLTLYQPMDVYMYSRGQ